MSQRKAKKSKILHLAMAAFFVYIAVSFCIMQVDIAKRKESLAEVDKQLKEQQYLNAEMQGLLDAGTDAEHIMKIAREKLGYAFPDERVFIDPNRK